MKRYELGALNFNGVSFRYAVTLHSYNMAVAHLAANGYYGKPFFCGMSSVGSLDLLTR